MPATLTHVHWHFLTHQIQVSFSCSGGKSKEGRGFHIRCRSQVVLQKISPLFKWKPVNWPCSTMYLDCRHFSFNWLLLQVERRWFNWYSRRTLNLRRKVSQYSRTCDGIKWLPAACCLHGLLTHNIRCDMCVMGFVKDEKHQESTVSCRTLISRPFARLDANTETNVFWQSSYVLNGSLHLWRRVVNPACAFWGQHPSCIDAGENETGFYVSRNKFHHGTIKAKDSSTKCKDHFKTQRQERAQHIAENARQLWCLNIARFSRLQKSPKNLFDCSVAASHRKFASDNVHGWLTSSSLPTCTLTNWKAATFLPADL